MLDNLASREPGAGLARLIAPGHRGRHNPRGRCRKYFDGRRERAAPVERARSGGAESVRRTYPGGL